MNVSVLFRVVVTKSSCATFSTLNSETALGVLALGWMEVVFGVLGHAVAMTLAKAWF